MGRYRDDFYDDYYGNRGGNYNRPQKKKSGAKETLFSGKAGDKLISVHAWNYSKGRGLINVKAFENSKSTRSESKKGNKFVTLMFEVFYHRTGNTVLCLENYNATTGKVMLSKLNMVISTKAANGGYFGQIKRR